MYTSKVRATNDIVRGLVADNVLVSYPHREILFESNLKKVVAKELVQEKEILKQVEVLKSLVNYTE